MSKSFEPIILVFEGASRNALNQIHAELHEIFKGTRYEDHYFVTDKIVRGIENPYIDMLSDIIKILQQINERQERRI